jgi:hypothetical protein
MSFDDDFDPESHTPEEIAAEESERRQVDELCQLFDDLDAHQAALERLAHEDLLGLMWFGDRPGWIDERLRRGSRG